MTQHRNFAGSTQVHPAQLGDTPTDIDELRAALRYFGSGGDYAETNNPADIVHDNTMRAGRAAKTVIAYADAWFAGGSGEDFPTVIGDLLGDFLHLCDALGIDFAELLEKGRGHYECELEGIL